MNLQLGPYVSNAIWQKLSGPSGWPPWSGFHSLYQFPISIHANFSRSDGAVEAVEPWIHRSLNNEGRAGDPGVHDLVRYRLALQLLRGGNVTLFKDSWLMFSFAAFLATAGLIGSYAQTRKALKSLSPGISGVPA
jgi:hypothetical protein